MEPGKRPSTFIKHPRGELQPADNREDHSASVAPGSPVANSMPAVALPLIRLFTIFVPVMLSPAMLL